MKDQPKQYRGQKIEGSLTRGIEALDNDYYHKLPVLASIGKNTTRNKPTRTFDAPPQKRKNFGSGGSFTAKSWPVTG